MNKLRQSEANDFELPEETICLILTRPYRERNSEIAAQPDEFNRRVRRETQRGAPSQRFSALQPVQICARHKEFQGSTPQLTGAPSKEKERITQRRKDAKSSIHQTPRFPLRLCAFA